MGSKWLRTGLKPVTGTWIMMAIMVIKVRVLAWIRFNIRLGDLINKWISIINAVNLLK